MSRNEHFESGHQKPEYFRFYQSGPTMWGIKAWTKGAHSPGTIAGWQSQESADDWISKNISPETHQPLPKED
jgi:hypothetical protein